jgi:hypothetical protein
MGGVSLGLILGAAHATDSDHLVALTGFRAPEQRAGSVLSQTLTWGVGHGASFLVLAVPITLFGFEPPPLLDRLAALAAGGLLITMGVARLLKRSSASLPAPRVAPGLAGVVHGLGGSSAVALLAMASYPASGERAAFLVTFVLATVASMSALTFLLSALLARAPHVERLALRVIPVVGIGLGLRFIVASL